ncbi:MAG: hypothetical protein HC937_01225 [Aquincola sp.]|nr:hypothetical protein [Aquincola sp.]
MSRFAKLSLSDQVGRSARDDNCRTCASISGCVAMLEMTTRFEWYGGGTLRFSQTDGSTSPGTPCAAHTVSHHNALFSAATSTLEVVTACGVEGCLATYLPAMPSSSISK